MELKFAGPDLTNDLPDHFYRSVHKSAFQIVNNIVQRQFIDFFAELVSHRSIIRFNIEHRRCPIEFERFPVSLCSMLESNVVPLGDYRFTIVVPANASVSTLQVEHLDIENAKIRKQELKTVKKYTVDLYGAILPSSQITHHGAFCCDTCTCDPNLLVPYISSVWDWALRFICRLCGKSYCCNCFRKAFDSEYEILKGHDLDSIGNLSQTFLSMYEQSEFRDGICHFCQDISSDLRFCHPMYGSKILVHYGPYIYNLAKEKSLSHKEAENEVRSRLGIPNIGEGWISETELLHIVKEIFPDQTVEHQASPVWLGRQRFDIYLPNLKLAIEYQGRQHYEAVSYFGGYEGLLTTQERDIRKARLAKENDVSILYFRYDEEINRRTVEQRLMEILK